MRHTLEENFLRLVRLYTFNTPIRKGKYRLFQAALSYCSSRHDSLPVKLKDGRRFSANLSTGMQDSLYFLGEYETVLTRIAMKLIAPGDVCVDVGANFGWYTSLMYSCSGDSGEVHAFEPTPQSFAELTRNCELMGSPPNVFLNNIALGDAPGTVHIHVFKNLSSGYASLATREGVDSDIFDCKMLPLDDYLTDANVNQVDFVKVDIEGAELKFMLGAERLFKQRVPPVFMMEMAAAETKNFGYHPAKLIEFIASRAEYEFFAVNEYDGSVKEIKGFTPDEIGANVFCVPLAAPPEKRVSIREQIQ